MKILITGIAGSWGRAFTKLLKDEHEVVGIDRTESMVAEYKRMFPDVPVSLTDFSDWEFDKNPCDLIIHLAAYKHIDLCEKNVASCIENNLVKTIKFYERAKKHGVKIVFVSTDKAVNPYSVYGMTKALGERLTLECGGTVVRSGNIYGSTGSVIDIWKNAIKEGKPLRVTDLRMERYFINVDEAVTKAWKEINEGKRLVLIDIGGLQKIKDIISNLLKEFGYSIDEYPIEIIGKRPGERLIDEIRWEEEPVE